MKIVCLDPGHGGHDPGAVGFDLQESKLTLALAIMTRDQIISTGISCFLTRDDDTFIRLIERSRKSNEWGADVFVSIHINGFTSVNARGFETFVHSTASQKSLELQDVLHEPLGRLWTEHGSIDRGRKKGNFYVIRPSTKAPSCLVEFGFITNRCDNELLHDEPFLKENAVRLGNAIASFQVGNT